MMCTKILSCILCGQPNFPNVDALRVSLLKVTARPLKCPICGDELLGLDKLTIHLFGHSLLEDHQGAASAPEIQEETSAKGDSKRNTSDVVGGSLKSLRKVRRREPSSEAEVKRSENGTDIGWNQMSPASENSPCGSNYCSECDVEFRDAALLRMHREVFHEIGAISSGSSRIRDVDKRFVCHICPKEFKMKGSLKIHMRVVHAESAKKICLEGANRVTITQGGATSTSATVEDVVAKNNDHIPTTTTTTTMSMHMLDQHQNIAIFQPPLTTGADGNGASQPEPHIIQIIDPRQLAQVVYLPPNSSGTPCADPNIPAAQPFAQDSSNVSPRRIESPSLPSSPLQQGQPDNPKPWECEVCRKSFTTKYFLKKHNRLHTGEMPYTCGICSKSFTFQQSYHKHLLYHSDEKPHVCSVCNRAFKELSTLHNHERIHSGEKPFACETCGKCFRQRVSYLVHRRIHTGLMPYKCSGCEKSFRYKVSQRTHKCPASPPGTVVRKTGDLLQKLLQSSAILPDGSSQQELFPVGPMGDDNKQTADYVNRTLDELVQGTYNKLYDQQGQQQQLHSSPVNETQFKPTHAPQLQQIVSSSPIDGNFPRIENLCLLSPSAFDGGQLEDLEGLKLDNGW
uniref:C2H2-type domain-containing protein n=1 Tax=Anopheles atroparvus TaxID=41427 RepID=A0AAG5CZR8_ANOAO